MTTSKKKPKNTSFQEEGAKAYVNYLYQSSIEAGKGFHHAALIISGGALGLSINLAGDQSLKPFLSYMLWIAWLSFGIVFSLTILNLLLTMRSKQDTLDAYLVKTGLKEERDIKKPKINKNNVIKIINNFIVGLSFCGVLFLFAFGMLKNKTTNLEKNFNTNKVQYTLIEESEDSMATPPIPNWKSFANETSESKLRSQNSTAILKIYTDLDKTISSLRKGSFSTPESQDFFEHILKNYKFTKGLLDKKEQKKFDFAIKRIINASKGTKAWPSVKEQLRNQRLELFLYKSDEEMPEILPPSDE